MFLFERIVKFQRYNVILFLELIDESMGVTSNAVAFQVYGGPVVTILGSKTSRKILCNNESQVL